MDSALLLPLLDSWTRACLSGDEALARALLSPSFTLEDGRAFEAFWAHERAQHEALAPIFSLRAGASWRPKILALLPDSPHPGQTLCAYAIQSAPEERLLFRLCLTFGPDHLICGNNHALEIVAKRSIRLNGEPMGIALALREDPQFTSLKFFIHGLAPREMRFEGKAKEDGFSSVAFLGALPAGPWISLRAFAHHPERGSSRFAQTLFLPDLDPQLLPVVSHSPRRIGINPALFPVNLQTRTEKGIFNFPYPREAVYSFEEDLISFCATDALDHDWHWNCEYREDCKAPSPKA